MKRIGLLGGTFNPIHMGHLSVAQTALEKLDLDKVIFIPSNKPPHKSQRGVVPARDRLNMVKLAIKDNRAFESSDIEVKREGKSYSIDTVRYFLKKFPKSTKLYFIIGGDSLSTLHLWKDIDQLLKLATFVVVNRPGMEGKKSKIKIKKVIMPGLHISSTYLRKSLATSMTDRYLIPRNVFRYIKKHKLYSKGK